MKDYDVIQNLLSLLPEKLSLTVSAVGNIGRIEEIHIRRDKKAFLKLGNGIKMLDIRTDESDIALTLSALTGGSLYAHGDTINRGYISYRGGIRVGICGTAVCDGGKIISVDKIDSLNIRIPHILRGICDPVISALFHCKNGGGILIYSLPGVGKTTLLRDMAITLSSFPYSKRICLIDSRSEIGDGGCDCPTLDIYRSYPMGEAIEMAVRTMSPDIIICDEIGGDAEFNALLSLCGKGVPVIASAHGGSYNELLLNKNIRLLNNAGLFSVYVGLKRQGASLNFDFKTDDSSMS